MRHNLNQQRSLIQQNCQLLKGWRAYALAPVEDPELGTLLHISISFTNGTPIPASEVETFLTDLNLGYLPDRTVNDFDKKYVCYFQEARVPTTPQFAVTRAPARSAVQ